jgi:histone H3
MPKRFHQLKDAEKQKQKKSKSSTSTTPTSTQTSTATKATKTTKTTKPTKATKDKELTVTVVAPKKRRWRRGTVALRQIREYQRTTDNLLKKRPFIRTVRAVAHNIDGDYAQGPGMMRSTRISASAFFCLQHVSEAYLTDLVTKAMDTTVAIRKRKILKSSDITHVCALKYEPFLPNPNSEE